MTGNKGRDKEIKINKEFHIYQFQKDRLEKNKGENY
jgi:hypothetical protein